MRKIWVARERLRTWEILLDADYFDVEAINKRIAALQGEYDALADKYEDLLNDMQEEYYSVRGIPVDSVPGNIEVSTT
jgi:hypothetical protein